MALACTLRSSQFSPLAQIARLAGFGVHALGMLAAILGLFFVTGAHAQATSGTQQQTVKVGLYVSPPFVMEQDGRYTGMAIELWEAIASELKLQFNYEEFETVRTLVDATANKNIDVAVTNLTITERRAARIDFTQPWFDAGLRIMVNEDQGTGFWALVTGLQDSGYLRAYAWLAFIIVVVTLLFTVFDRHFDKDFPHRWRDGLAESFYSVMSIATSGRAPARRNLFGWIGRIWQSVWLVCGIAVLAYVTSTVTSVMTTLALTNQINSVADLPGKTVGVSDGSTAEDFVQTSGIDSLSFKGMGDSVDALVDGRVAAIIGDTPVLEYYAHTHPDMPTTVVGAIFQPDKYGFGLPHQSELTRRLTVEVIGAHESGLVGELRTKYLGAPP